MENIILRDQVTAHSIFVSDRDFAFTRAVRYKDNTAGTGRKGFLVVGASIPNSESIVPVPGGVVRGIMITYGWVVTENGSGGLDVAFVLHADPQGWIPSAIFNSQSINSAYIALRMKQEIEGTWAQEQGHLAQIRSLRDWIVVDKKEVEEAIATDKQEQEQEQEEKDSTDLDAKGEEEKA